MDAGLFMGRSFRVGWGPGWTLAHCAQQISAPHSKEATLKGHNADFSFMPQTVRSKTYACTRAHIQHSPLCVFGAQRNGRQWDVS